MLTSTLPVWEMTSIVWALAIGYWDFSRRRIPNALTFGAGAAALGVLAATGGSPLGAGAVSVAEGVGLALVLTLPGYFLRQLGGGDVKLLLAVALLGGLGATFLSFVIGALATAIHAGLEFHRSGKRPAGRQFPLGAGLALGFAAAVLSGQGGAAPW